MSSICDESSMLHLFGGYMCYIIHIATARSEHREHVRPQHQNIKNILSNHNKDVHRETTTPEHIEHTLKS